MAVVYGVSEATKEFLKKLPKQIRSLDEINNVRMELRRELDSIEDRGLGNRFRRWRKQRVINKIGSNVGGAEHAGARGEDLALRKLSELPDDYHVFCGVNKDLGKYVTYRKRRDLKSAQMDFVVLSTRGVNVIEVKNWRASYYESHRGLSPHEQVDRAGRVLWISLKSSWFGPRDPPVTGVLLSLRGTIPPDPRYGHVAVRSLSDVNRFLQNRQETFSEKEVGRLVGRIKGDVTK